MKRLRYLLGFVLVVGCTDNASPECVQICTAAAGCGMLPSPLGIADNEGLIKYTAMDNCEVRCANSSGQTVHELARCIDDVLDGTSDVEAKDTWCTEGCAEIANCIEQAFEDPRIVGTGQVQVDVVSVDDLVVKHAMSCAAADVDSFDTSTPVAVE